MKKLLGIIYLYQRQLIRWIMNIYFLKRSEYGISTDQTKSSNITMPIRFRFNPRKTTEAVALILYLHGGKMKYLGLLKLLYMSDRKSLELIDKPITGDFYYSMKYGLVLSSVYDLIKGKLPDNDLPEDSINIWREFLSTKSNNSDYEIRLLNMPRIKSLSKEEICIIHNIYREEGTFDSFVLAEKTHKYPEWRGNDSGRIYIPIEEILKNIGKSQEKIEYIKEVSERERYLDKVFEEF